jgi:anti-sigma regulatory factor (Ser/Thr protein kinase)
VTEFNLELPASLDAPAEARHALDGWLSALVDRDTADQTRLAASELVANAVRHAGLSEHETFRLGGVSSDDRVHIEVEQPTSTSGARMMSTTERRPGRSGFGLRIVDEMSAEWGVDEGPPGVVWFEVRK